MMDGIDVLIFGAFALGLAFIAFAVIWIVRLHRLLAEEDVSGVGAMDAARLRGADLNHGDR